MQEIVTQRLELRLLAHADIPAFVAYRRDPDVARYQSGDTSYKTADDERLVASQQGVDFGEPVATEALGAVIARLFDRHGIHRVYAQADDRNVPVQRLFERLGLRCEARLLEADWFKGEWTTLRTYAILRREWRAAP